MTKPKILLLDIETAPAVAYVWRAYDENVSLDQIISPPRMLCFAAKWLGKGKTHFLAEWNEGHLAMVQAAWNLLDEADVVMHFNGKRFDIPHLNREFVEAGLGPPSPYQQIDLLQTARRQFKFFSNKLAYVTEHLSLEGKVAHEGFMLWRKVMAGDEKAQRKMAKYNRRDVTLLEDLYEILRPWITTHPNLRLWDETLPAHACPRCGSTQTEKRGFKRTAQSVFQQHHCHTCGAYFRSTKSERTVRTTNVAA